MEYIAVKIFTTTEGIDHVSGILLAADVQGFVIEDKHDYEELFSKKNSYDWDYVDDSLREMADVETNITAYLDKTPAGYQQLEQIQEEVSRLATFDACGACGDVVGSLGRLDVMVKNVCDDEWRDNWKEFFKTERITDRIIIKPSWEDYEKTAEEQLILEIDPGVAFGTGKHPTTTMCMQLMEKYLSEQRQKVLDVGCGSGILSIAAALLGAQSVLGVEIDPMAVAVAMDNVELNHLSHKITITQGDLTEGIDFTADVLVANIMADSIIMLTKNVKRHLSPDGIYIFSGIIEEKMEEVSQAVQAAGFKILEVTREDFWCAAAAKPI